MCCFCSKFFKPVRTIAKLIAVCLQFNLGYDQPAAYTVGFFCLLSQAATGATFLLWYVFHLIRMVAKHISLPSFMSLQIKLSGK